MRITFLNPSAQLGGAERSLLDVLASLRDAEPDWPLHLIVSDEGPLVERAADLGVRTAVVPFSPGLALLGDAAVRGPAGDRIRGRTLGQRMVFAGPGVIHYVRRLRRALREIGPDLIHSNGFKMHVLGTWAKPAATPIVWHVHDYVSARPVMSRLLRWHADRAAGVVTNSKSVALDVREVCGGRLPVHPVYNAVDLEEFTPAGPVLDLDLLAGFAPAPPETIRVGLVATLGRWKGHATFIDALSMLDPSLPFRAYVVGGALYQTSGSQYSMDDLRDQAQRRGVADRLGFTGYVSSPSSAMRALDVVVHASTQPEPFGLVIAEAMACGRALVASQAGGSAELFRDEIDALAYAPGDAKGLSECLQRVITEPALRARLAETGRATAERDFDRRRLASDLIPLYRGAMAAV